MERLEFIFSQAVDEDFMALCKEYDVCKMFTKIPNVMGQGYSSPKLGTAVWPQLNCMYIIYCPKDDVAKYREIIQTLRTRYPKEGIACFMS